LNGRNVEPRMNSGLERYQDPGGKLFKFYLKRGGASCGNKVLQW